MDLVIICGGPDIERDISIQSGQYIQSLMQDTFNTKLLILPKYNILSFLYENLSTNGIVFNALHGKFGEGGDISVILREMNYKFIKCKDHITIYKSFSRILVKNLGIPVIESYLVQNNDEYKKLNIKYPRISCPNDSGSSYGMQILNKNDVITEPCLVSEYIENAIDISVTIINGKVMNISQIQYDRSEKFFSSHAKHSNFKCIKYHFEEERIKSYAIKIMNYFECNIFSRIDFLYKDGDLFFLEVNTVPGMTENSIVFQACDIENINRSDMIESVIYAYS